jgi:hypothetical protein
MKSCCQGQRAGRCSVHWRAALGEAAPGATRKTGYLQAKYRRVRSRRGHQRAVIAVAHAQLEVIHTLLSRGELYTDLGADFFERQQAVQSDRPVILHHEGDLLSQAPAAAISRKSPAQDVILSFSHSRFLRGAARDRKRQEAVGPFAGRRLHGQSCGRH